jgi:NAD(P)-dependent dehydrogenase (short-subunit alcohol dehydrogenase family)
MLKGKCILVTGGSGLLGREICLDIERRGGIAISLDIHHQKVDERNIQCDVTCEKSISSVLNSIVKNHKLIHGLVNNAYPRTTDWGSSFEAMTTESFKQNVFWQMNSYLTFCQKIIPILRHSGGGSVINMASIYGVVGNDFTIYEKTNMEPPMAYTAIKGGIINATRFLASKYGKEMIRFNCVSPGGIFDNQDVSFVDAYSNRVPLKRMGTPCDIAPAVSFLLSDDAKYITGHNLIVDGGWTII